jgi:myo-inositol-1(or 4)-monophosphatase
MNIKAENYQIEPLIETIKKTTINAGDYIASNLNPDFYKFKFDKNLKKEVKAKADAYLEGKILPQLMDTGISILSEEAGYTEGTKNLDLMFIVDPLDGTFNFLKGSGPSVISVALWQRNIPIFGAIYDINKKHLIFGGKKYGAFINNKEIQISHCNRLSEAVLFTGFPVRFDFNKGNDKFWSFCQEFAKVRMVGSAAASLANVAMGYADAYFEENIMIWDIAAGLAIVEGAGGVIEFEENQEKYSLDVMAANKKIMKQMRIL